MTALRNDIRARLYINGAWRDISTHIRHEQGIATRYGYGAEDEFAPPATCRFTLDNGSSKGNGDYTERNPLGQYYPYLGRSTPVEVAIRTVRDTATTTATNSWGSTDTHTQQGISTAAWNVLAWSNAGGVASDFNKASGKATHLISAANDSRYSWLPGYSQRNSDWACTFSLAFTNVTGGVVGADFFTRGQGAITGYYAARVQIETDELISIDLVDINGTSLTLFGPSDTGLTHSSGQALRIRMQSEGRTIRAKVWAVTGVEPFAWQIDYTDEGANATTSALMDAAGFPGIRSYVGAGNTNVPVTFSYDDFEMLSPEFAGEIAAWPHSRDTTGRDRTVSIVAADVTRRLGTGASPLNSALRRYILNPLFAGSLFAGFPPWAYWPLEEDEFAIAGDVQPAAGSGIVGFAPPTSGATVPKLKWAADSTIPGGKQAPALSGGGALIFFLGPPTQSNSWSVLWCMKQTYTDGMVAAFSTESGHLQFTAARNASSLTMDIQQSVNGAAPTTIMSYAHPDKGHVEEWHQFALEVYQTGGDYALFLHVDGVQVASYTQSPGTLEGLRKISLLSVINAASSIYYAHLVVYSSATGSLPIPADFYPVFLGNAGETALERAFRLLGEEHIDFGWYGTGANFWEGSAQNTEPMGAQRAVPLLDLLRECTRVDNGLLYSQRSANALQFRTLSTMYARSPWVTLSLSGGHFSPPWSATEDDQALRNDITASRQGGGSVRYALSDGSRMSVSSPADGGAGRYDSGVTVNVETDTQLPGQAQWRVHLGTADEDRFPSLLLQLARAVFRADSALTAKLRDLTVGDLITLTGMATVNLYDDLDELVVGVAKQFDQDTYNMTLTCRPGSRYNTGTVGSGWRLGSHDTVTNEALDSTETGVDVAFTGTAWTAANAPFDIVIGGERMTVTAISGSSSPQTFTVTRNVNNLPGGKSHATGAAVRLADPNYLGM